MNKMSDAQRRKIFKLAGEKGLDQEMLHAYIHSLTGKDSLRTLNIMEAVKVIDGLEGKKQNSDNMITDKQRKFIEGLAKELGWKDENNKLDQASFNAWLKKNFHIDSITWLTSKKASDVLQGLIEMKKRGWKAGFEAAII